MIVKPGFKKSGFTLTEALWDSMARPAGRPFVFRFSTFTATRSRLATVASWTYHDENAVSLLKLLKWCGGCLGPS